MDFCHCSSAEGVRSTSERRAGSLPLMPKKKPEHRSRSLLCLFSPDRGLRAELRAVDFSTADETDSARRVSAPRTATGWNNQNKEQEKNCGLVSRRKVSERFDELKIDSDERKRRMMIRRCCLLSCVESKTEPDDGEMIKQIA
ncbi:hypothetical protein MHYP_G00090380 [Metynnis hypsauchen]